VTIITFVIANKKVICGRESAIFFFEKYFKTFSKNKNKNKKIKLL
jgi:hypothetical protein